MNLEYAVCMCVRGRHAGKIYLFVRCNTLLLSLHIVNELYCSLTEFVITVLSICFWRDYQPTVS